MKGKHFVVSICSVSILSVASVSAYLDPGTGGAIFNSIWPFVVALFAAMGAFFAKWFWHPIKKFFKKPSKPFKSKKKD